MNTIFGITGEMTAIQAAGRVVLVSALLILAVMLIFCLLRTVMGPRIADRIVAINMMGTLVMVIIAILALLMQEGYLVDICLIYAMISFLAVIVLTKVYLGVFMERKIRLKDTVTQTKSCPLETESKTHGYEEKENRRAGE